MAMARHRAPGTAAARAPGTTTATRAIFTGGRSRSRCGRPRLRGRRGARRCPRALARPGSKCRRRGVLCRSTAGREAAGRWPRGWWQAQEHDEGRGAAGVGDSSQRRELAGLFTSAGVLSWRKDNSPGRLSLHRFEPSSRHQRFPLAFISRFHGKPIHIQESTGILTRNRAIEDVSNGHGDEEEVPIVNYVHYSAKRIDMEPRDAGQQDLHHGTRRRLTLIRQVPPHGMPSSSSRTRRPNPDPLEPRDIRTNV